MIYKYTAIYIYTARSIVHIYILPEISFHIYVLPHISFKLSVRLCRVDNIADAAKTPSGLADILGLSPNTKETVAKLSTKGVLRSRSSASPDAKGRNDFMSRVSRAYTPIVEKILSNPTFDGEPQPERVLEEVVRRVSKKRKGVAIAHGHASKRKLAFNSSPPVTKEGDVKKPSPTLAQEDVDEQEVSPAPFVNIDGEQEELPPPDTPPPPVDEHTDNFFRDPSRVWKHTLLGF